MAEGATLAAPPREGDDLGIFADAPMNPSEPDLGMFNDAPMTEPVDTEEQLDESGSSSVQPEEDDDLGMFNDAPMADSGETQKVVTELSDHSDIWNAQQKAMGELAAVAGLPPAPSGNARLIDAIKRSQAAGYDFPNFSTTHDPTGDRTVTKDMEGLIGALERRESATNDPMQRAQVAKEKEYWQGQLAESGMSAEQWQQQTGEADPVPSQGIPNLVNLRRGQIVTAQELEEQEAPAFKNAIAAGTELISGLIPKTWEDVKHMTRPPTGDSLQEDIARSKPEFDRVMATPPYSKERFLHWGNLGAQILGAVAPLEVMRPKPRPKPISEAGPIVENTAQNFQQFTGHRGEPKGPSPAGSAHGIGEYYGLDAETAQRFSKSETVKSSELRLDNPLVIASDAELRAAREATGVNPDPRMLLSRAEAEQFTQSLRDNGHDGVILNYPEAPGGRQAVVFPKNEQAPIESTAVEGGAGAAGGEGAVLGKGDGAPSPYEGPVQTGTEAAGARVFYRGTHPGRTERIVEPFEAAEGKTFAAITPEGAKNYGPAIETIAAKPEARILYDNSAEFWKVIGRKRPPNGYIGSAGRRGEKLTDIVNDAIRKAEAAGYDALSIGDADIGTVILNENAFSRPGKAGAPSPYEGPLPAGTGVSKIGKSIEAKAVEAKLTEGFDGTAGYDPISVADQARRATEFIRQSPETANAVIRGEAPLPEGLRGPSLITAMEEELLRKPNARAAYELANSPLVSGTSAAAQDLRLMRERTPDSLTAKFDEIKAERRKGNEKRGQTVESVQRELQKEIKKSASSRQRWEEFVREIICP